MARRIYKVESVEESISTIPSKTIPGSYEQGIVYQIRFRLDDPAAKDILLDGVLNIVAFKKENVQNFTIGKKVTIEVIDNL